MVLMGQGRRERVPARLPGHDDAARCRSWSSVRDYSSFPLLVNISAGYPGHQGVGAAGAGALPPADGGGLHRGERARVLPVPPVRPAARACWAAWRARPSTRSCAARRARPRAGMDAQSLAHVFVAFCILLGNVRAVAASGGEAERVNLTHDVSASGSRRAAHAVRLQLPLQGQPVLQVRRAPVRRRVGRLLHRAQLLDRDRPQPVGAAQQAPFAGHGVERGAHRACSPPSSATTAAGC